jgi:hypothetical protein
VFKNPNIGAAVLFRLHRADTAPARKLDDRPRMPIGLGLAAISGGKPIVSACTCVLGLT